ncbi:FixH family protein [Sphingomonas sp. MMS24-J13]|uniref:FixH family protein n=1 Tax=Sphingomonas sp. MMS24-J13 TaxID=3238686 RepID=UPI0038505510
MTRTFTGWHMLGIMLAMFGTIIAVNLIMATYAIRTFGGTVVDNSYVASQDFNHWLAEARAQKALGWTIAVTEDGTHRPVVAIRARAGSLEGATVHAVAIHPLGRAPMRDIVFTPMGGDRHIATWPLPAGRWLLRITVRQGGHTASFDDELKA